MLRALFLLAGCSAPGRVTSSVLALAAGLALMATLGPTQVLARELKVSTDLPLQRWVELAEPHDILRLAPGDYATGPVIIDKPLSLIADGAGVVIDGGGSGTLLTLRSPGIALAGLTLQRWGADPDHHGCRHSRRKDRPWRQHRRLPTFRSRLRYLARWCRRRPGPRQSDSW